MSHNDAEEGPFMNTFSLFQLLTSQTCFPFERTSPLPYHAPCFLVAGRKEGDRPYHTS